MTPGPFPAPRLPPSGAAPLLSVQVLRALAALGVVVHHAGYDADTIAARFGRPPLGLDRVVDGSFGIHLFFVVSGFIMLRTARDFGRPGAPWRFLGRRLLRIAPLYWLMTTLVLLGGLMAPTLLNAPAEGWPLIAGSYLFVPVMRGNGEIRPLLGQGWTLNYEMAFYGLLAAAMVLPRRAGLAAVAAVLVGLVALGRIASPDNAAAFVWTSGLLLEFLFGLGVGLAVEAGFALRRGAGAALAFAGLAAALALGPATGAGEGLDPALGAGLPAAAILLGCTAMPPWRPRGLALALGILGDASYSLYLCHPFVIRLLRVAWTGSIGDRLPAAPFLILAVAVAVLAGLALFRLVERPMTRRLDRLFPASRHRMPESAAAAV